MKTPPLINIDKFKKRNWLDILSPNREVFWHYHYRLNTYHYQRKNNKREGIEIEWSGNPFGLGYFDYYTLKK